MSKSQSSRPSDTDHFSVMELRETFESLGDAEYLKLNKAAGYLGWKCGLEGDELLGEAMMCALKGNRHCRRDLPPFVFLVGIMKSFASEVIAKRETDPLAEHLGDDAVSATGPLATSPSDDLNPEEVLIAREEQEHAAVVVGELEALFADDEKAQLILMGKMDDMTAEEIRELGEMDKTTYATARRRMRRKIDRHYPKGWRR